MIPIVTSRTGTAKWRRVRRTVLAQAFSEGRTQCPYCGTQMDFERSGYPNSAEVDHIIPHSLGGEDSVENSVAACRWCNQSRGNGTSKRVRAVPTRVVPTTRVEW